MTPLTVPACSCLLLLLIALIPSSVLAQTSATKNTHFSSLKEECDHLGKSAYPLKRLLQKTFYDSSKQTCYTQTYSPQSDYYAVKLLCPQFSSVNFADGSLWKTQDIDEIKAIIKNLKNQVSWVDIIVGDKCTVYNGKKLSEMRCDFGHTHGVCEHPSKNCPDQVLSSPTKIQAIGDKYPGSTSKFRCTDPFDWAEDVDDVFATCPMDGSQTWNFEETTYQCYKKCQPPSTFQYVASVDANTNKDHRKDKKLTVKCNEKHSFGQGNPAEVAIECGNDGNWKMQSAQNQPPACIKKCQSSDLIYDSKNIEKLNGAFESGKQAKLVCKKGNRYSDGTNEKIIVCNGGTWELKPIKNRKKQDKPTSLNDLECQKPESEPSTSSGATVIIVVVVVILIVIIAIGSASAALYFYFKRKKQSQNESEPLEPVVDPYKTPALNQSDSIKTDTEVSEGITLDGGPTERMEGLQDKD